MPTKRCSWGTCNSDSRYYYRPYMDNVTFYPFPKPSVDKERCLLWIKQCHRPHSRLKIDKIGAYHFICSKVCHDISFFYCSWIICYFGIQAFNKYVWCTWTCRLDLHYSTVYFIYEEISTTVKGQLLNRILVDPDVGDNT